MEILEHVPLAPHVTFRAGGTARFFARVASVDDLREGIAFARARALPLFVLGGGANTLPPDGEWEGLVLQMAIRGIDVEDDGDQVRITAEAGEVMDDVVVRSIECGLQGLVSLSWVPGTVGAAPIQNIGCYGVEVASFVEQVEVFDVACMCERTLSRAECLFGYRTSLFKTPAGKGLVVTRVRFVLPRAMAAVVSFGDTTKQYKDVAGYFAGRDPQTITPAEIRTALAEIRGAKFRPLSGEGSAGSYFENPRVPRLLAEELQSRFPGMPIYPTEEEDVVKLPAGYLVHHCAGLRGAVRGTVGVSPHHALAILNLGGATSADVRAMACEVVDTVKKTTGVVLVPEVAYLEERGVS